MDHLKQAESVWAVSPWHWALLFWCKFGARHVSSSWPFNPHQLLPCIGCSCVGATFIVDQSSPSWRLFKVVYRTQVHHWGVSIVFFSQCGPSISPPFFQLGQRQLQTRMQVISVVLCHHRRLRCDTFASVVHLIFLW